MFEDMPKRIDEMSTEEIELRIALLERTRPAEPTVTRLTGRKPKTPIEEKWFSTVKVCPHCSKEKNVGKDFGVAVHRGVQYANSWCTQCRSETSNSYRTAPRKNRSKHNPDPAPKPAKKPKK